MLSMPTTCRFALSSKTGTMRLKRLTCPNKYPIKAADCSTPTSGSVILNSACGQKTFNESQHAQHDYNRCCHLQFTANGTARTEKVTLCMAARTMAPEVMATTYHVQDASSRSCALFCNADRDFPTWFELTCRSPEAATGSSEARPRLLNCMPLTCDVT